MPDPNIIGGSRVKSPLRFRRQPVGGYASGILEEHEARYGGLVFSVTRRPKRSQCWPGPGIRATVYMGNPENPPYFVKVKTINDGKLWCRMSLCYILRGTVPFGDHCDDE